MILPRLLQRCVIPILLILFLPFPLLAQSSEKTKGVTTSPGSRNESETLTASQDVKAIQARGKLVMICYPHQLGAFVSADLAKGLMPRAGSADHFTGIDVDIMRGFAEFLGVELEIRRASAPRFSALIPDLLSGEGDLIASAMSVTEERRKKVDFSQPYYTIYPVIVVRRDSSISSIEDLQGRIASAMPGSSHEARLLRLGIPRERIHSESFLVGNYAAVTDGIADFTLGDSGTADRLIPEENSLKIAFRLPEEENYAIAVRPGSDLLKAVNQYLDQLRLSGELERIIQHHLGT